MYTFVDENLSTNILNCTHTVAENAGAWWVVDIGSTHSIHSVVITNRGDCCGKVLDYAFKAFFPNPSQTQKLGVFRWN